MGIVGATSLGQYLVKRGIITDEQLLNAVRLQKAEGMKIGSALMKLGYINENQFVEALSDIYNYPIINISKIEIDPNVFKLIPNEIMRKYKVVPFAKYGNTVKVAVCDPSNTVIEHIKFLLTGFNLEIHIAKYSELIKILEGTDGTHEGTQDAKNESVTELIESALVDMLPVEEVTAAEETVQIDAPIIKLANKIIS
jgi:type IV pilus assembly protein PilB